jgi:hypothetical protein
LKRFIIIFYIAVCSLCWHFLSFQAVVNAQESLGDSIDCTDVSVDYSDDPTLTREERLRLMDKAFIDSLNKFELCQSAKKMSETSGAASGGAEGGAEGGSGDSTGDPGGELAGKSVASSTMSGTETPKAMSPSENMESGESGAKQDPRGVDKSGRKKNGNMTSATGKLPEDIPPASNDDTLAAQIRYAAENETDPVKKEQLWDEYRKYKGLTPKK